MVEIIRGLERKQLTWLSGFAEWICIVELHV